MDLIEEMNANLYRHPWELARIISIISLIPISINDPQFADVGAGDMHFTNKLTDLTQKEIFAVDINYKNIHKQQNIITLNSICDIPDNSVDILFLLDVLEHIENENNFLQKVSKKLKRDGFLILTVPAYNFLFSPHDVFLKHYRRYSLKKLIKLLKITNLEIENNFYFFTTLFFYRLFQVAIHKIKLYNIKPNDVGNWTFSAEKFITKFITWILIVDFKINFFLQKFKIKLPGLSICIKCKKKLV